MKTVYRIRISGYNNSSRIFRQIQRSDACERQVLHQRRRDLQLRFTRRGKPSVRCGHERADHSGRASRLRVCGGCVRRIRIFSHRALHDEHPVSCVSDAGRQARVPDLRSFHDFPADRGELHPVHARAAARLGRGAGRIHRRLGGGPARDGAQRDRPRAVRKAVDGALRRDGMGGAVHPAADHRSAGQRPVAAGGGRCELHRGACVLRDAQGALHARRVAPVCARGQHSALLLCAVLRAARCFKIA